MSTTTPQSTLRAEGEEQFAGEREGLLEMMMALLGQHAGGKLVLPLDELVGCFLSNNCAEWKHYKFNDVLGIKEKVAFVFAHASVTYRATVYLRREVERNFVVLQLPNNGFTYSGTFPGDQHFLHKRPGWVALPTEEAMACFPKLRSYISSQYKRAAILYNRAADRLDMTFEPEDAAAPFFMVTYEPGSPEVNLSKLMTPIRRPAVKRQQGSRGGQPADMQDQVLEE